MTPSNITNLITSIKNGNTTYGSVGYVVDYAKKHPEDTMVKDAIIEAVVFLLAGGASQSDMYCLSLLPLFDTKA